MASDLQQQIERVQAKARVLGEKYLALRDAYDSARGEINDLKAQILARDRRLKEFEIKVEDLSVAASAEASAGSLDEARTIVAEMMREIDRCIADILEWDVTSARSATH